MKFFHKQPTASFISSLLMGLLLISTLGALQASVVVTNTGEAPGPNTVFIGGPDDVDEFYNVAPNKKLAAAFTTGSTSATLNSITLASVLPVFVTPYDPSAVLEQGAFTVQLWNSVSVFDFMLDRHVLAPGTQLESLGGTTTPNGSATYTSIGAALAPLTSYFLVFFSTVNASVFNLSYTTSSEQTSDDGWTIEDISMHSFDAGDSWRSTNRPGVQRFSIDATLAVVPEPSTTAFLIMCIFIFILCPSFFKRFKYGR